MSAQSICGENGSSKNGRVVPQKLVLRLLKTLFVGLSELVRKVDFSTLVEGIRSGENEMTVEGVLFNGCTTTLGRFLSLRLGGSCSNREVFSNIGGMGPTGDGDREGIG